MSICTSCSVDISSLGVSIPKVTAILDRIRAVYQRDSGKLNEMLRTLLSHRGIRRVFGHRADRREREP